MRETDRTTHTDRQREARGAEAPRGAAPVLWDRKAFPEDMESKGPYRDRVATEMPSRMQFQGGC